MTGAAGFIGYHISKRLLEEGWRVVGLDCMSDYYDVTLKVRREAMLMQHSSYKSVHAKVETPNVLMDLFEDEHPNVVIHLAAQAGVRYSIQNPRAYLETNINGTFELLEAARAHPPAHMLFASTSSAYGANTTMPYKENMRADHQMSFYAATKKSTENMAHSYSHLFELPITMFRFFTVYGPWGRPDMAIFKFTRSIHEGNTIDVYNEGVMSRDFTYIDDLINGLMLLMDKTPCCANNSQNINTDYGSSPNAQYRVVNIGSSKPEKLSKLIECIESSLGKKSKQKLLPMQPGDVPATWADTSLLENITGYRQRTQLSDGVDKFVKWYLLHYKSTQ